MTLPLGGTHDIKVNEDLLFPPTHAVVVWRRQMALPADFRRHFRLRYVYDVRCRNPASVRDHSVHARGSGPHGPAAADVAHSAAGHHSSVRAAGCPGKDRSTPRSNLFARLNVMRGTDGEKLLLNLRIVSSLEEGSQVVLHNVPAGVSKQEMVVSRI